MWQWILRNLIRSPETNAYADELAQLIREREEREARFK
jgi:hypothetical protein